MASTKTIASFFVRDKATELPVVPHPRISENESHYSAGSGSDNDGRSEVNERLDEQEIADDDEVQLTQREPTRKRKSAPHFGHEPIMRKKTTRCGSILLTCESYLDKRQIHKPEPFKRIRGRSHCRQSPKTVFD